MISVMHKSYGILKKKKNNLLPLRVIRDSYATLGHLVLLLGALSHKTKGTTKASVIRTRSASVVQKYITTFVYVTHGLYQEIAEKKIFKKCQVYEFEHIIILALFFHII